MNYFHFIFGWPKIKDKIEVYLEDRLRRWPHGATVIYSHRELLYDFVLDVKCRQLKDIEQKHIESFLDHHYSLFLAERDRKVLCDFVKFSKRH